MAEGQPIQSCIRKGLRRSLSVRSAVQELAKHGKVDVKFIRALALDGTASIGLRLDAITMLLALEESSREAVRDLLNCGDNVIVIETLKSIKALRTEWALPEVVAGLKTTVEERKRAVLAWTLAAFSMNRDVQKLLLNVVSNDGSSTVRNHAIEALGRFRSPKVVEALLGVLKNGNAGERFWALYSLGELADPRAKDAIRAHLHDRSLVPGFGTVGDEAQRVLTALSKTRRTMKGKVRNKSTRL